MCWNRKSIKEQGSVSMENNNGKKLNINYKLSDYERPSVTADILIFSQKGSDGDRLRLLLIKRKHDPYEGCFALPGGFVNPDETVDQAAKRELEEETGYRAAKMELLITVSTTVAFCNETIDVYLATELTPTQQHLDEDEFVEVECFTIDELKDMVLTQKIQDSKTAAAIMAYYGKYCID